MKGASSHLVTRRLGSEDFKWQGSYGAFSVGPKRLRQVVDYIRRQKEHHARGDTEIDWEPHDDWSEA